MGMRGIIAVEQGEKEYKVTTVQWLTDGDKCWKLFTEGMNLQERVKAAKTFSKNITKYNHISFLDYRKGDKDTNLPSHEQEGDILVSDGDRRLVTSSLVFEEGGASVYKGDIVVHPHFQNGQAVVIQKTGRVIIMQPNF